MTRGDKAALRLTVGLGLAVVVAYGMGLQAPYVVCIMALLVLCKPGPPLPLFKSFVIAGLFAALVAAGVLMVPLLENYAAAGAAKRPAITAALTIGSGGPGLHSTSSAMMQTTKGACSPRP